MDTEIIKIIGLKRDFRMGSEFLNVLKGIDLTILKNEYVALMGPSGSGKSTLMNLIGCLDTPTSGSYFLRDRDVSKLSENELASVRNKEIGFVFQTFNLIPRLTALENVALPLIYAGLGKKERLEMAVEACGSVGLLDRMKHRPSELSGGQRMELFQKIQEGGNTLVVVTHEEDIAQHTHRIVRLRDGLIETDTINTEIRRVVLA